MGRKFCDKKDVGKHFFRKRFFRYLIEILQSILHGWRRNLTAITQECREQYETSPGGNTPQSTNYTATCLLSRKLSNLDEPGTQETAGGAGTISLMYTYGPPHMAELKQDNQLEHTYSSCVRIRDVAQMFCQRRWTIGKSGKRGSGISVLAARHEDDDDITVCEQIIII